MAAWSRKHLFDYYLKLWDVERHNNELKQRYVEPSYENISAY
jgi:hypothetical protein